ncbi:MAG TPA: 30S ribosomal protein S20 [Chloroflexota bacterium]|nr:30S ribosomal protein S20 [Chloroflexota bacterium]
MAHSKSAKKRILVNERRRLRNRAVRTKFRRAFRGAREAIAAGVPEPTQEALRVASSEIDKAVSKGVVHWRTAARKKSRLMRRANKAAEQAAG